MRTRPEVELRNLETNELSTDRIWTKKTVKSMWFNNNDQFKDHTIAATIKFLTAAEESAKSQGFVDVIARPTHNEGDEFNLDSYYIHVEGYRQETNEEYARRLSLILLRWRNDRDSILRRKDYFLGEDFKARCELITNRINGLNRVNKKKTAKKKVTA